MRHPKLGALVDRARVSLREQRALFGPATTTAPADLSTGAATTSAHAVTTGPDAASEPAFEPPFEPPAEPTAEPALSDNGKPGTDRWFAIAILVAIQTALLFGIFAPRLYVLTTGTEVVLDVTPVDPRSLFRGDYVIITTEAHRFPAPPSGSQPGRTPGRINASHTKPTKIGASVYAVLERDGTKPSWRIKSVGPERPAALASGEIVMVGRRVHGFGGISYGIESYFVPEGTGKAIENAIRNKSVTVKLAIDGDGTAAIKALMIDGKAVHATSLL